MYYNSKDNSIPLMRDFSEASGSKKNMHSTPQHFYNPNEQQQPNGQNIHQYAQSNQNFQTPANVMFDVEKYPTGRMFEETTKTQTTTTYVPEMSNFGVNLTNAAVTFGMQHKEQLKSVNSIVQNLRRLFNVENMYVIKKLGLIFFPYWLSAYKVTEEEYSQESSYASHVTFSTPPTPRSLAKPDLYIPVMAFLTSLLVFGFNLGFNNQFSPGKLSTYVSSVVVLISIELVLMTLLFYVAGFWQRYSLYDMLAYSGYKFVVICYYLIWGWWLIPGLSALFFMYFVCSFVFFTFRCVRILLIPVSFANETTYDYYNNDTFINQTTNYGGYGDDKRKNRVFVLLIMAVLQFFQLFYITNKFF